MKTLGIPLFNLHFSIADPIKMIPTSRSMNKTAKAITNKWVKEFKKFPTLGTIVTFKLLVVISNCLQAKERRIII